MRFCKKCKNPLESTLEIDGVVFDISKRKFCLSCYKFVERKKRGDSSEKKIFQENKFCPKCKTIKSLNEFVPSKRERSESICKNCSAVKQYYKRFFHKKEIIEYKGGCCEKCGYNKCFSALEFHHKNPNEKDFNIGGSHWTDKEKLKRELDKCDLLCCNCHRELHEELNKIKIQNLEKEIEESKSRN